jgi:flagellar hook assembly protein FlgD
VDPVSREGSEPSQYALARNYPNPFNPSTLIGFTVPAGSNAASVQLTVYDVRGARVRRLLDMSLPAGGYTVRWDGTSDAGVQLASGVFFYELRAGAFTVTRSMMLLR